MDLQERQNAKRTLIVCMAAVGLAVHAWGQQAAQAVAVPLDSPAPATAPVTITLDEAIHRAQASDPTYAGAVGNGKSAAYAKGIARSALLPNVTYYNQYLYTQGTGFFSSNPNGDPVHIGAPIFIANNAIHEYLSQAQVSETIGMARTAEYRAAGYAAAAADAEAEIARRGLLATVVTYYYTLLDAQTKLNAAGQAQDEAQRFLTLTRDLEAGREVAHADVLKAELQFEQRQREYTDAQLTAEKARLDFAVLLFPDPRTSFKLAEDAAPPLPSRADFEAGASRNNPELRSAMAALHENEASVTAARAGYLPDLALNYTYGIDAAQFAIHGPDGVNNLGYSAFATVDIPVWDWFATHDRVRQSEIKRDVAKVQLTNTQRRLIANIDELYNEAAVAHDQLGSLNQSVSTAQESLRLTNLRYKAGEANSLEVVDAQNQLIVSENSRADGLTRYRVALANLQTLTGTL